jgi:hypothetical protein
VCTRVYKHLRNFSSIFCNLSKRNVFALMYRNSLNIGAHWHLARHVQQDTSQILLHKNKSVDRVCDVFHKLNQVHVGYHRHFTEILGHEYRVYCIASYSCYVVLYSKEEQKVRIQISKILRPPNILP